jgi:4-amino-4-deoxy-L-arabinose transferase-like glycosyltransferase
LKDVTANISKTAKHLESWRDHLWILLLFAGIWAVNTVWLLRDTRPPVWDMALHQTYALNYLGQEPELAVHERSGTYPPFVHMMIALCYLLLRPAPDVAALANVPATLLLLWATHGLARELAGPAAARWSCFFVSVTPFLVWMSRETVLDYWLSAWFMTSLILLRRTRGFSSRPASLLLGLTLAFGMLTKWLFAGLVVFPLLYVFLRERVWTRISTLANCADSLLLATAIPSLWYVPNLPRLARYFAENMAVGAREGEPPVVSLDSGIYYLRLLEGYQLFGLLFFMFAAASYFVLRRRLLSDPGFWLLSITGGWLVFTLLRTKDPRFTMPLLPLAAVAMGAWVSTWKPGRTRLAAKGLLVAALCIQTYAINFGVSWLPRSVVLAEGYQGSLRWDWNLYLQDYFGILGPPRQENWKQREILDRIFAHAREHRIRPSLAVVPDLAHFNAPNFLLYARLAGESMPVDHPQSSARGVRSFDGFNYVLMTEGEQGMPWTTRENRRLNRIIVDEHEVLRIVELFRLPNGDDVRLYHAALPEAGGS